MGLVQAIKGAATTVMADQWKEYFYCESLSSDVLVCKASKKVNGKVSSNTKGVDNVITNGSVIAVNEGQCMLIVEQGKIVDFSAEAGAYIFDSSTEPSLFAGDFGQNIIDTFMNIGKRFTFGGDAPTDQRVYFINTKEVLENKFGTSSPIPIRVVDSNSGLDFDTSARCNGEYTFEIVNPLLFYQNVSGNVGDQYRKDELIVQMRTELLTSLQPAFGQLSGMGIRYSAFPAHTLELTQILQNELSAKWTDIRGIKIVSIGINSITIPDEDLKLIQEMQRTAALRNPAMAAATLAGAQADAMKLAAANESTGPMMAFAGMNMATQAGGMSAANLYQMAGQQPQQAAPQQQSFAGAPLQGATPQQVAPQQMVQPQQVAPQQAAPAEQAPQQAAPAEQAPQQAAPAGGMIAEGQPWFCPNCGTRNEGKFCFNCGTPRP